MARPLLSVLLLLLLAAAASATAKAMAAAAVGGAAPCPCTNASWCQPIQQQDGEPLRPQEIFGFRNGGALNAATKWQHYDWRRVTTVAWADPTIPELTCRAHAAGARAVMAAPDPLPLNGTGVDEKGMVAARALWVEGAVAAVKGAFMDGIVFDWEAPADPVADVGVTRNYVALINATRAALHAAVPGSQVSVCLAWSPNGIDGRWYPNLDLIDAADVAYVMMYDTRSQVGRWL